MNAIDDEITAVWKQMAPVLDEAMATLDDTDCDLIVLGIFEKRSVMEMSRLMKMNASSGNEHLASALKTLHQALSDRGIQMEIQKMAMALSAHSIEPPPVAVIQSVVPDHRIGRHNCVSQLLTRFFEFVRSVCLF